MKKILVLGGSYFAGRVLCMLASARDDLELFIVNRGTYAVSKPHIAEFKCERHDTTRLLEVLPPLAFDATIDFCAYEPGDIALICETLGTRVGHYVYISTSSVYAPSAEMKTEDSPLGAKLSEAPGSGTPSTPSTPPSNDPVAHYVAQKLELESECQSAAQQAGVPWTILRPSFIYGPYNYAPRESWFVEKIVRGEPVPVPVDATARFSFVYVADVARALLAAAGNAAAFGRIFNLAGPEEVDYSLFLGELTRANGAAYATENVTVRQVLEQNIALPFPLAENDLTSGALAAEVLGVSYTPLSEGISKAFTAFKNVYAGR